MATGIVSIAAADHGYRAISDVLIVLAAVALPVLIVVAATAWRRESWNLANLDVSLGLCTYIAACAVVFPLGMYSSATYATAVETGWHWLTIVSLVFFWIAFAAWVTTALHTLVRFRRARSR